MHSPEVDRKGLRGGGPWGVNAYGHSGRKISVFFKPSLTHRCKLLFRMVRKSNENVWPCSLFTCLFEQTKYQVDLNVNRLQCAPYWAAHS